MHPQLNTQNNQQVKTQKHEQVLASFTNEAGIKCDLIVPGKINPYNGQFTATGRVCIRQWTLRSKGRANVTQLYLQPKDVINAGLKIQRYFQNATTQSSTETTGHTFGQGFEQAS